MAKNNRRTTGYGIGMSLTGPGTVFTLAFIAIAIGLGILMSRGITPKSTLSGLNDKYTYQIDTDQPNPQKPGLQLRTIKLKQVIPPTFDCGDDAIKGSPEPYILWAIDPAPGTPVVKGGAIKAFYQDEWPLTLGAGAVSPSTSSKDHVVNPNVGDETQKDANGFPFYPALFLSDVTSNPDNRSGDAQNGGIPHKPDEVFGAWKPLGGTFGSLLTPNNLDLGPGADTFPAASNVKFANIPRRDEPFYGAEIIWKVDNLGLTVGHSYRAQFIIHDGDSEGDISEGCTTIQL